MKTNLFIVERVKAAVPADKWGFVKQYERPANVVPYYVNSFNDESFKLFHAEYKSGDFIWAVYEPGDGRPEGVCPVYSMQLNDPRLLRGAVLEMYPISSRG